MFIGTSHVYLFSSLLSTLFSSFISISISPIWSSRLDIVSVYYYSIISFVLFTCQFHSFCWHSSPLALLHKSTYSNLDQNAHWFKILSLVIVEVHNFFWNINICLYWLLFRLLETHRSSLLSELGWEAYKHILSLVN